MGKLRVLLSKVDAVLVPLAAKSLSPPASAKHLDALARDVFGGSLPAELREWFGWHDGQRSITELDPKKNFTAMSAKNARDTWRVLNNPKHECLRPKRTWLPLFENGGGDYLMYDTAGAQRGALLVYLHDDEDWPRAPMYKSLSDWATRVATAQAKLAKAPKRSHPFDLGKLKFETIGRAPSLAKLPVGTVLRVTYRRDWIMLFLKTAPASWMWNASETLTEAIDELDAELRKKASDYLSDEDYVDTELAELEPKQRKTLARASAS